MSHVLFFQDVLGPYALPRPKKRGRERSPFTSWKSKAAEGNLTRPRKRGREGLVLDDNEDLEGSFWLGIESQVGLLCFRVDNISSAD